MDRSDIAYLIAEQFFPDEKGVLRSLKTESMIYVQVTSVSSSEWFEGGRNGLNPELRFITNRFDYHGEEIIRYNGNYYRIYRTYISKSDSIELYCEKRKGDAESNTEQL